MFGKKSFPELWKGGRKILLDCIVSRDKGVRDSAMDIDSLFASLDRAAELDKEPGFGGKYQGKGLITGGKRGLLSFIGENMRLPLKNEATKESRDFWGAVLRLRIAATKRLDCQTRIMREKTKARRRVATARPKREIAK